MRWIGSERPARTGPAMHGSSPCSSSQRFSAAPTTHCRRYLFLPYRIRAPSAQTPDSLTSLVPGLILTIWGNCCSPG